MKVLWKAAQLAVQIRPVSFVAGAPQRRIGTSECISKQARGLFLSFPLFRLSRSENLPRTQCDPHAEGDIDSVSLITRLIRVPGDVAQLGEHLLCKQGVSGSNPLISTSTLTTE
jgi:hypothetical protein